MKLVPELLFEGGKREAGVLPLRELGEAAVERIVVDVAAEEAIAEAAVELGVEHEGVPEAVDRFDLLDRLAGSREGDRGEPLEEAIEERGCGGAVEAVVLDGGVEHGGVVEGGAHLVAKRTAADGEGEQRVSSERGGHERCS